MKLFDVCANVLALSLERMNDPARGPQIHEDTAQPLYLCHLFPSRSSPLWNTELMDSVFIPERGDPQQGTIGACNLASLDLNACQ